MQERCPHISTLRTEQGHAMLARKGRDLDDLRASDAIFARGAEKVSRTRARMNSPPWGSPGRGAFFSFHLAPFAAARPHRALGRTPRLMPCAPELVLETRALDMQESCVSRVLYKILALKYWKSYTKTKALPFVHERRLCLAESGQSGERAWVLWSLSRSTSS